MGGLTSLGHGFDRVPGAGAFAVPHGDEGVGVAGHFKVPDRPCPFAVFFPVGGEAPRWNAVPGSASEQLRTAGASAEHLPTLSILCRAHLNASSEPCAPCNKPRRPEPKSKTDGGKAAGEANRAVSRRFAIIADAVSSERLDCIISFTVSEAAPGAQSYDLALIVYSTGPCITPEPQPEARRLAKAQLSQ